MLQMFEPTNCSNWKIPSSFSTIVWYSLDFLEYFPFAVNIQFMELWQNVQNNHHLFYFSSMIAKTALRSLAALAIVSRSSCRRIRPSGRLWKKPCKWSRPSEKIWTKSRGSFILERTIPLSTGPEREKHHLLSPIRLVVATAKRIRRKRSQGPHQLRVCRPLCPSQHWPVSEATTKDGLTRTASKGLLKKATCSRTMAPQAFMSSL